MIAALEKARGLAVGATRLVLSIESALGVLNAYDMSLGAAARRVARRSAARRTATSTPISAAPGRSTGRR